MGNTKNHNGLHIVNDTTECGRVVYWEMHGGTNFAALLKAFEDSGLDSDLVPRAETLDAVCKRTMREFAVEIRASRPRHGRRARVLVRPTDEGHALVEECREEGAEPLVYDVLVEAIPTGAEIGNEDAADVFRVDAVRDDADTTSIARELHARLNGEVEAMSARAVGRWLVRTVMPELGAVALRDRGGVYFVPRAHTEFLDKVIGVVTSCSSHVIHQIPATTCREAIAAIVAALTTEVTTSVQETEVELDTGLTARKAGSRIEMLGTLQHKVRTYETALGVALSSLHEQCDSLAAELSILALSETDDGDAHA